MYGNNSTEGNEVQLCPHDDDQFKYNAYIFTYALVFPVAFLCNIVALVVFFKQKKSRGKPSYVIMVNLALSDGSFSLTLPLRLAYYMNKGKWTFPDWVCRLCVFGFYVNLYSSILLLTLLSLIRWYSINYPLRHHKITSKLVSVICLAIWVFVGGSSVPFLSNGVVYRDGVPRCFEPSSEKSWSHILRMNYVGLAFGFVLPFCTIIFCCSKIIHCLRSPNMAKKNKAYAKRNKRSVCLVIMVIATFLLCFLPYHLIRTLHLHAVNGRWNCGVTNLLQRAVAVTLCLAAANCVVNPLLYYYSTKKFKEDMNDTGFRFSRRLSTFNTSLRSYGQGSEKRKFTQQKSKTQKHSKEKLEAAEKPLAGCLSLNIF